MIKLLKGLMITLSTTFRTPVTGEYPIPEKRIPVKNKFMGFPALTYDFEIDEPYCTGCMVCIRDCPTACMTANMKDNEKFTENKSSRKKIIESFEINLGRCILCGICVDVCNFDAIEMSHEHERSKFERNANRVALPELIEMGTKYQQKTNWSPKQEKNRGTPKKPKASPEK